MPGIDDLAAFTNLGVAGVSVYIVYYFARYMAEKSFEQIKSAQDQINRSNQEMIDFMQSTFKENTKAMSEMVNILKEHVRLKDEALEMLKERYA